MDKTKLCTKCKEIKDISEFRFRSDNPNRLDSWCKSCNSASNSVYRKIHPYDTKNAPGRKETNKKYYEKNKHKIREYEKENRERINQRHREMRRRIREEFIEAYGGKCECCGESRYEFLTLEHKNGGGSKHRKSTHGTNLVHILRREGYPKEDYGLLCWNCNSSKGMHGYCPHERE